MASSAEPRASGAMARALLAGGARAVLASLDADSGVHAVLVNAFLLDAEPETAGVLSRARSRKVANLRRDPRAALTLIDGSRYVTLLGLAEVRDGEEDLRAAEAAFAAAFARPPRPAAPGDRVLVVLAARRILGRR